jgi:hypothetical protein
MGRFESSISWCTRLSDHSAIRNSARRRKRARVATIVLPLLSPNAAPFRVREKLHQPLVLAPRLFGFILLHFAVCQGLGIHFQNDLGVYICRTEADFAQQSGLGQDSPDLPAPAQTDEVRQRMIIGTTRRLLNLLSPGSGVGKPVCGGDWMTELIRTSLPSSSGDAKSSRNRYEGCKGPRGPLFPRLA